MFHTKKVHKGSTWDFHYVFPEYAEKLVESNLAATSCYFSIPINFFEAIINCKTFNLMFQCNLT